MVNLLFSVLCNLGVVNVKAAGLIFSSCIMLGFIFFFFYTGSQQKKESRSVIYRPIQLPQVGREAGTWSTDPGDGELFDTTFLLKVI